MDSGYPGVSRHSKICWVPPMLHEGGHEGIVMLFLLLAR